MDFSVEGNSVYKYNSSIVAFDDHNIWLCFSSGTTQINLKISIEEIQQFYAEIEQILLEIDPDWHKHLKEVMTK